MLKKELVDFLDVLNHVTIPELIKNGFKATPINAREGLANLTRGYTTHLDPVKKILDDMVPNEEYDVPVRIYHPEPTQALGVILYVHGGGHMGGSVTVYDPLMRRLANRTQHIVVGIEYRLSPENPYPAGLHDVQNVIRHIYPVLDSLQLPYRKEMTLFGDSGGGALVATCTSLADQDASLRVQKQILIYPSLDYTMSFPSIQKNGTGYLISKEKIRWYFDSYFQNNESREEASPLFHEFHSFIPPTLIFTAEYCPLLDEDLAYIEKLKQKDIPVQHIHFDNMIHTFFNMQDICAEECDKIYESARLFLASS